ALGPCCLLERAERGGGGASAAARPPQLALVELAELLFPGQHPRQGRELVERLVPQLGATDAPVRPERLRAAFAELVRRFLAGPRAPRRLLAWAAGRALERLRELDAVAAGDLAFALALVDEPARWLDGATAPAGGALSEEWPTGSKAPPRLENLAPRWADEWTELRRREPVPVQQAEPRGLDEPDLALVDRVFEESLPRALAAAGGGGTYRGSQHEVARGVARTLGREKLLLVHAPTGTGKTLAYLVPVMIWALRQRVRVGIATFTRTLQEQAMERDVPIALRALEDARAGGLPEVAMLKGRANYVCWRALATQAPEAADSAGWWLAWLQLALFGLADRDGDLDRLGARCLLPGAVAAGAARELEKLLAEARAQTSCCTTREDRDTCAAEAARRRAERAHVVLTNHSFALARREFFRHVVFDECEHLHDQARSAFSSEVALRDVRETLLQLRRPKGPPERSPLARIERATSEGSDARTCAERSIAAHAQALDAVVALDAALFDFRAWREDALRSRDEKDSHSLFREYALSADGAPILDAQAALAGALDALGACLAQLAEHLDLLPMRGAGRLRRVLDLARGALAELLEGVLVWIPRQDGVPSFAPETFYDTESDGRGESVLVARVLLPHEYLGRAYFPDLESAVCISATTWLRGGFEASSRYLGLWRAANPAENEERAPRVLETLRAPEIFDYTRVLVLVPRDAPLPSLQGGAAHAQYVQRFVAHLAERTRGRMLVLFTNAETCVSAGRRLAPFFAARGIPFWYQRMPGAGKEELAELFRARRDSVLFGLDTFWYGADFPGETLEYLVLVRLPYGVPDRYHHAQCASIGADEQRRTIYMPRALAKFRQGFGRLMRRESDRGCVFVLDGRALEPRHRPFLAELPLQPLAPSAERLARFVRIETDACVRDALVHMQRWDEVCARGLGGPLRDTLLDDAPGAQPERAADDVPF
ncbi:MAG: hypothetical protein EPO68_14030, partial [Planctomycetota bacterium]